MTDDRPDRGGYRIASRVFADKGAAEPLPSTGKPVVLATEHRRVPTDDEHLTEAVIDATLDILVERPRRGRAPRGAAALTDLLDPALVGAASRDRDDIEP